MNSADVRFLFGYDRWAMDRVLTACVGIDDVIWTASDAIDQRGLAGILVHALGAHQRWRLGLGGSDESPRPEQAPLPSVAELTAAWLAEYAAMDAWLASLDDRAVAAVKDGSPLWQYLSHLVNHDTQHRSEAAVLLTAAGHSPGDLDLIDYIEQIARGSS
jgi:uncharacterized damage-inducible protein DinB